MWEEEDAEVGMQERAGVEERFRWGSTVRMDDAWRPKTGRRVQMARRVGGGKGVEYRAWTRAGVGRRNVRDEAEERA